MFHDVENAPLLRTFTPDNPNVVNDSKEEVYDDESDIAPGEEYSGEISEYLKIVQESIKDHISKATLKRVGDYAYMYKPKTSKTLHSSCKRFGHVDKSVFLCLYKKFMVLKDNARTVGVVQY